MSRAFTPPKSMSNDDIRTVADVRRDIWTSAFYGMFLGSLVGVVGHGAAQFGNKRGLWKLPLNRNTFFLSVLLGMTSGSFFMATTTGKNEVHKLHPIFQLGAEPPKDNYQQSLERAKEEAFRQQIIMKQQEMEQGKERNRLFRRQTLEKTIRNDHGGLSDAHGGHWLKEEDQEQWKSR